MHFDGKMKNNRRKIERGLEILPYGNSTTQTIGKCGGFRLCHDTGSACYSTLDTPGGCVGLWSFCAFIMILDFQLAF